MRGELYPHDLKIWAAFSGSCLHSTVNTAFETCREVTLWKKGAGNESLGGSLCVLPVAGLEQLYPGVLAFLWPSSVASGLP